jgi:methyltransferase (TIGR00027 family)
MKEFQILKQLQSKKFNMIFQCCFRLQRYFLFLIKIQKTKKRMYSNIFCMEQELTQITPDQTAIRIALWRALHVQIDSSPHVFIDEVGEKIIGLENWRNRWDMNPDFSLNMRALIVGRSRFIEDLVLEEVSKGVSQYVILGAGFDTFTQRHSEIASQIDVYEIDRPGQQEWKEQRLKELGYPYNPHLHFVSVDFGAGGLWWQKLIENGFDASKPAVVVSTDASMYHTKKSNQSVMNQMAKLAPGSTFAMTFLISPELLEDKELSMTVFIMKRAQETGASRLNLFPPDEILKMAAEAGIEKCSYIPASKLHELYFQNRSDNLNAGSAEGFFIGRT